MGIMDGVGVCVVEPEYDDWGMREMKLWECLCCEVCVCVYAHERAGSCLGVSMCPACICPGRGVVHGVSGWLCLARSSRPLSSGLVKAEQAPSPALAA